MNLPKLRAPRWLVKTVAAAMVEALEHVEVTVNRHGEVAIRLRKEV